MTARQESGPSDHNEFDQPVGQLVAGWGGAKAPERVTLTGRFCRLVPLDAQAHTGALFEAYADSPDGRNWTYLPVDRFDDVAAYRVWTDEAEASTDPMHFTVIDLESEQPVGTLSFLRISPSRGR